MFFQSLPLTPLTLILCLGSISCFHLIPLNNSSSIQAFCLLPKSIPPPTPHPLFFTLISSSCHLQLSSLFPIFNRLQSSASFGSLFHVICVIRRPFCSHSHNSPSVFFLLSSSPLSPLSNKHFFFIYSSHFKICEATFHSLFALIVDLFIYHHKKKNQTSYLLHISLYHSIAVKLMTRELNLNAAE